MPHIVPISKLNTNPNEVSILCHENNEPVFLTKNGFGDMVVMSMENYEQLKAYADAFLELKRQAQEAEPEKKGIDKKATELVDNGIEKLPMERVLGIFNQQQEGRSLR